MKLKRRLVSVFLCLIIGLTSNISLHAYQYTAPYTLWRFSEGINNKYYLIYSSPSIYTSAIQSAVSRWYSTPTAYNFNQTNYVNLSNVDCYAYDMSDYSTLGSTYWYGFVNNREYTWTAVNLNTFVMDIAFNNKSNAQDLRIGVAAHELGHSLGLGENNSMQNTIMCQYEYGRIVTSPQADDCDGVNNLYR